MKRSIFSEVETNGFNEKLQSIKSDNINFPDWESKDAARKIFHKAYFAQAVSRIRKDRLDDFLNYLLVIVGSKGARADIRVWDGFGLSAEGVYISIVDKYDTPINRRYLHMFLKAVLHAHRSWALTAFVKFLRGNKVAGGKATELEGFGDFHKDSGWTEAEVKATAYVLFDEYSEVAKLFMQYDADLADRVYEESKNNENIPYDAQFAATSKTVNSEFLKELVAHLEKRELAPKPTDPKKAFKPRKVKVFTSGDIIRKENISDLPSLSVVEIPVTMRMKSSDENSRSTVQIVIVTKPEPRYMLDIWRIVDGKAYYPDHGYGFDKYREALEGATYIGEWEQGVQAQKARYAYPHDYIGLGK